MRTTLAALLAVLLGGVVGGCSAGRPGIAPELVAPPVSRHQLPAAAPELLPRVRPSESVPQPGRAGRSTTAQRLGVGELVIRSLGVRARIRPIRFAGDRLQIPASVDQVGLWSDGARLPDAVGTTVLVGHVSDNSDRPGVLAHLGRLRAGGLISLRAHGRSYLFRAVRVRRYPKSSLPRAVFSQSGPHRLVLITCSRKVTYPNGAFHYAENLVVTARQIR